MMWITWLAVLLQLSSSAVAAPSPDEGAVPSPDEGAAPSPDEVFQNSVLEQMRTMLEKMETLMGVCQAGGPLRPAATTTSTTGPPVSLFTDISDGTTQRIRECLGEDGIRGTCRLIVTNHDVLDSLVPGDPTSQVKLLPDMNLTLSLKGAPEPERRGSMTVSTFYSFRLEKNGEFAGEAGISFGKVSPPLQYGIVYGSVTEAPDNGNRQYLLRSCGGDCNIMYE